MELQIKKEKTKTRAGEYIFINCPEISYFQWHPFTLTRYVYAEAFDLIHS
jgi:NADPH oxidase